MVKDWSMNWLQNVLEAAAQAVGTAGTAWVIARVGVEQGPGEAAATARTIVAAAARNAETAAAAGVQAGKVALAATEAAAAAEAGEDAMVKLLLGFRA